MLKRPLVGFVTVAGIAVLLVSGCSSPNANDAKSSKSNLGTVSIANYSSVKAQLNFDSGTVSLPLDSISLQVPSITSKAQHAVSVLTDKCMEAKGFPSLSQTVDWNWAGQELRTFGLWDVNSAEKFGFGLDPATKFPTVNVVSQGVDYNDKLPACSTSALKPIQADLAFLQSPNNVDYVVYQNAYDQTVASKDGKAAFAKRTSCMKAKGVIVDPDTHAPSDDYQKQSQEIQIKIATIYANCSVQTGAVQELFDIDARYQAAYMDKSEAQVAALKTKRAAVEKKLDDVITGAST